MQNRHNYYDIDSNHITNDTPCSQYTNRLFDIDYDEIDKYNKSSELLSHFPINAESVLRVYLLRYNDVKV